MFIACYRICCCQHNIAQYISMQVHPNIWPPMCLRPHGKCVSNFTKVTWLSQTIRPTSSSMGASSTYSHNIITSLYVASMLHSMYRPTHTTSWTVPISMASTHFPHVLLPQDIHIGMFLCTHVGLKSSRVHLSLLHHLQWTYGMVIANILASNQQCIIHSLQKMSQAVT